jgi:hypothetical protein
MKAGRSLGPTVRAIAIGGLALWGFAQMAGDIFHCPALKAVAAATAASPAPRVFSSVRGLETFSTRFFLERNDVTGAKQSIEITPERYARVRGPYNRRNVYGAVLAYGPTLESDTHTIPLFNAVSGYALCGKAPLLRELGIPDDPVGGPWRIRLEIRPTIAAPELPLTLGAPCL